jgi:hypothetical protein
MRVLNNEITNKEVVKKMFHFVLEKLEQVVILMETLHLSSLSIEEVAGHLRAMEQRKKITASPTMYAGGWLLLKKEEWTTRMKAKEKGGSSGSGGCGRGHGSGGADPNSNPQDGREGGAGRGACHNCGKMGYWARECQSKAKKAEAHVAQNDGSFLLLLEAGSV